MMKSIGVCKNWKLLLIAMICFQGQGIFAQKFTASVSKNPVAVNEVFQISFQIEGGNGRVNYPQFSGMQILSGPNTSQSMQFVNGQMSQSVTYYFQARVQKEGTVKIGAADVTINGKKLTSDPLSLKVVKGSAQPQAAAPGQKPAQPQAGSQDQQLMKQIADNVFVRAFISKKEAYIGEQITLTYKLYSRATLVGVQEAEAPKFTGFWVENIDMSNAQFQAEVLDGVQYRSASIRKTILIPQRAGELKIDPYKLETNVRVTVQPNRRGDLFESFFSRYQDVPYTATAPAISIKVKPLPSAGKPESFQDAVGDFKLDVSIDKEQTQTGEPFTLKIKLSGEGNLKNIQAPELKFPADFDLYDPKIDSRISVASGRVRGSKSFDFLIIPLNPGEFKLPSVNFSYFDPKDERYHELQGPELVVRAEGEAQMPIANMAPVSREDVELLNRDIRFIKTGKANLREQGSTFWASGAFWSLAAMPFLLFGFIFWYKRKKDEEAGDVVGTRMKYATKLAKKKLAVAEKHISLQDKSFYDEVDRAIWGYLGDKLALNPSELNRQAVKQKLSEKGVGEEVSAKLETLLDSCEMALYAPVSTEGEKTELYKEAINLVTDLEKQIG